MEQYLKLLTESLEKKNALLDQIFACCEMQKRIFEAEEPDFDGFDQLLEEKGTLIDRLDKMDDGFDSVFSRISEQLSTRKEEFVPQIRKMQEQIRQITDKSVQIQTMEARNKELVEKYFSQRRAKLGKERRSVNVARNYYATQNNSRFSSPQFMDSKK